MARLTQDEKLDRMMRLAFATQKFPVDESRGDRVWLAEYLRRHVDDALAPERAEFLGMSFVVPDGFVPFIIRQQETQA